MKTYYVTGSNGNVYRVKAENANITGRYISIMYHVRVFSVEYAYLARSAILRYVISYMPLYYTHIVYILKKEG